MFRVFGSLTPAQKIMGATVAILVGSVAFAGIYTVFPTASNQGYAPEQPIPFSHKLHAGQYKIDCKYCHVSADQSRHASVPAVNVCMNCHQVVKTDSPYIQKIQEHYREGRPIEWVRIHELPDFVFFNHRPHVRAGVSCETCHGDVKSMDRVYQYAPLTMGWCVQCHTGKTTPRQVMSEMHPGKERGDFSKLHPVAPLNCTTCHY